MTLEAPCYVPCCCAFLCWHADAICLPRCSRQEETAAAAPAVPQTVRATAAGRSGALASPAATRTITRPEGLCMTLTRQKENQDSRCFGIVPVPRPSALCWQLVAAP